METLIIIIFAIGYLAIALEHSLKLDKLIPALLMMALMWAIIAMGIDFFPDWFSTEKHGLIDGFGAMGHEDKLHTMEKGVLHHLGKTAEILFFLLGAMTIVEIIDYFDGFSTFKKWIQTRSKRRLLWIFAFLAFILSAIIDNLTATIVLITILQKIVNDRTTRLWFASLIVIAANAGGAWSPIGDVTTTMLWIGGKVSILPLVTKILIPAIVCMVVPTFIASRLKIFTGKLKSLDIDPNERTSKYGQAMLFLGLGGILFVPFFKVITHLPPYVGMMFSLGIVAMFAEIFSRRQFTLTTIDAPDDIDHSFHSPVHSSLSKIEMPSILFFLGILMAVAALESLGILFTAADGLKQVIPNMDIVVILLGVFSAIVDNVPLVAASMGMFDMNTYAIDDNLWHFIAYSAGTGGSMLIIGSAAGVVAMGMEKIDFMWYLRKITWLAALGFIAGAITFVLLNGSVH